MPDGILPDEGIGDLLEYILRREIEGVLPWQLMLWVNDLEPDSSTVLADLEEANFYGYKRFDMDRTMWLVPTVDEGCATSTFTPYKHKWTVGGETDETVYGYAMIDKMAEVIRFIQRFDEDDIVPLENGQTLAFLPTFTLTSAACNGSDFLRKRRVSKRAKGK